MSLSKKVVLTVSGYKISLSDSLQFYQNDQLKLIFEINKYGIDVASSFTHKTLMPLQPLTATLFIETPLGVDSIESANIEDNAVTFYLTSNQTQHIGTSTMQIKLTDDDGCQITLPSFTFEVQKNIYDNAVHISGILLSDENGNVVSDENGNTVNATTTTETSKQIKDFTLKNGVSGQEDILIQDDGVTKRIKSNELIDNIDLTEYATKTYVDNKISEISGSEGGGVSTLGNDSVTLNMLNKRVFGNEIIVNNCSGSGLTCDLIQLKNAITSSSNLTIKFKVIPSSVTSFHIKAGTTTSTRFLNLSNTEENIIEYTFKNISSCSVISIVSNSGINFVFDGKYYDFEVIVNDVEANFDFVQSDKITENFEKGYVATVNQLNNFKENLKIDRYQFDDDLLLSNNDNSIKRVVNSSLIDIIFEFDEETTSPIVEYEYLISNENTVNITSFQYNTSMKTVNDYSLSGGTTKINLDSTYFTSNEKHSFTVTYSETGRRCGIRIFKSETDLNVLCFKYFKAKSNGKYLKCVSSIDGNFADDRIMNYGIYKNEEETKIKYKNKTIICAGDSTTFGENGASTGRGISYHIQRHYPQCTVINNGNNGVRSDNFFNIVSAKTDWNDIIAVLSCYGANDGVVSGSLKTSIPQTVQENLLTAITDGFTYNNVLIDTEDKYWSLFSKDWYGAMGKAIEYIKFFNPMTQVFLHSYHPSDKWAGHPEQFKGYSDNMKILSEYYAIPFIDNYHELGITNKNSHQYLLDWAHLGDMGNELKGNFLAKQIEDKMLVYPYVETTEYAVKSLTMNRETETVSVDSSIYLYVKVAPYNATNKNIIWTSNNENITIETMVVGLEWQKIKITGVVSGETIVTATSNNGITANCTVTISAS